jgi:hypothetical protein
MNPTTFKMKVSFQSQSLAKDFLRSVFETMVFAGIYNFNSNDGRTVELNRGIWFTVRIRLGHKWWNSSLVMAPCINKKRREKLDVALDALADELLDRFMECSSKHSG